MLESLTIILTGAHSFILHYLVAVCGSTVYPHFFAKIRHCLQYAYTPHRTIFFYSGNCNSAAIMSMHFSSCAGLLMYGHIG